MSAIAEPDRTPPDHGSLTRVIHEVSSCGFGEETRYAAGELTVSASAACSLLSDPALAGVELGWASPGESTRLVKVLDAVEPRAKGHGGGATGHVGGGMFPGFLAPAMPGGRGETHALSGAAVVAAGFLPRAQEAIVEMSGEAAELSPLGRTHNLVVEFEPSEGADWGEVEVALRRGLLALAVHLAEAALEASPDASEELGPPAGGGVGGPRVACVTNLQTQGAFKDVFIYGRSMAGSLPTLIEPNELEDGAVVSGQYGHPSLKNPTYLHQNHPIVAALRRHDEAHLAGVVLCPEPVEQAEKELVSAHAARLCHACGFDAAIVTKEGGGNADADMALKMDALEDLGVTAVGLFAEMAGAEGTGPPIVVAPARATAMVSTGNYDERLELPAVDRALGGETVNLVDAPATDALEVPTAAMYGSLNPLGWGSLTCREVA